MSIPTITSEELLQQEVQALGNSNSTLKGLAAWAGAITGILGITSVLGLSFDVGSIGDLARSDQKSVVLLGIAAILLAVLGTAIATLANAVWNVPESESQFQVAELRNAVRDHLDKKKLALIVSLAAIGLALVLASLAIWTAVMADPPSITEGNRLMVTADGETFCGKLEFGEGGQVFFRAEGSDELVAVLDPSLLTETGDC